MVLSQQIYSSLSFGTKVLLANLIRSNGQIECKRPPNSWETTQELQEAGCLTLDGFVIRLVDGLDVPDEVHAALMLEVPARYLNNERG